MTEKRKAPAQCTPDILNLIIDSLHQGITLAKVLSDNENNPDFPRRSAIMNYINADSARKSLYTRAREDCADALAEQVIMESDGMTIDPARAANRMKARQWLASKIKPKVYGDKLDIDMKGSIDISAAILAGRQRAQLPGIEPLTLDNEIDPFS